MCPYCKEDLEEVSKGKDDDDGQPITERFQKQLGPLKKELAKTSESGFELPAPIASAPPLRSQPKPGEAGHVPGALGSIDSEVQLQPAKKIALTVVDDDSQGPNAWQSAQAGGHDSGSAAASNGKFCGLCALGGGAVRT